MRFTISNRKYYKKYDGSDNDCCWQMDIVSHDVAQILDNYKIDYDTMPEDWGTAYTWAQEGTNFWIQFHCINVETATFEFHIGAKKQVWLFFAKQISDSEFSSESWIHNLQELNET